MKPKRFYNVIFPIWMLVLFPPFLFAALPLNFLIDLAVVVLTMNALNMGPVRETAKQTIWKVWGFGFLADFIGSIFMFLPNVLDQYIPTADDWVYKNLLMPVMYDPFGSPWGLLWIAGCIFIAALCIYFLNRKISFRNTALTEAEKKKLSLSLAVFTAPYLFLIPIKWFA